MKVQYELGQASACLSLSYQFKAYKYTFSSLFQVEIMNTNSITCSLLPSLLDPIVCF